MVNSIKKRLKLILLTLTIAYINTKSISTVIVDNTVIGDFYIRYLDIYK